MSDFEKYLRENSRSFKMDPAAGSFDKIMEALDEKKKKKRGAFWWFLIPGIALAVGLGIWFIYPARTVNGVADRLPVKTQKHQIKENTNLYAHTDHADISVKNTPATKDLSTPNHNEKQVVHHQGNNGVKNNGTYTAGTSPVSNTEKHTATTTGNEGATTSETNSSNTPVTYTNTTTESTATATATTTLAVDNNDPPLNTSPGETFGADTFTRNMSVRVPFTALHTAFVPGVFPVKTIRSAIFPAVPKIREPFSRWSIGAYMQAGASRSNYYSNYSDTSNAYPYAKARQQTDIFMFSYAAGIKFRYSPLKWLSIESGIGYTHYESSQLIGQPGLSISGGNMNMDQLEIDSVYTMSSPGIGQTERISSIYGYMSVPLNIYYQKKWNWIGLEAGAGVVFDFAIHTHSYMPVDSTNLSVLSKDVNQARLNIFGVTAQGHVNVVFNMGKFSLYMGPTFRYRLNSMFRNDYPMQQHMYFIGGETGLRYNF